MRAARSLLFALLAACGTLGTPDGPPADVPSSGVGPFRKLSADEVSGIAPFVLHAQAAPPRDPSALALDADPSSERVALYAVAAVDGHDAIVRTRADDARSFYGDGSGAGAPGGPAVVLRADAAWEGGALGAPAVLRAGGSVYLYYAAKGGVGLAVSDDGLVFGKRASPVLAPDATAAWEHGAAPSAPSVAVFPDGTWHMLYAAGDAIGEATSPDGVAWTRSGGAPVLVASASVDPSTLAPGQRAPFDTARVSDPLLAPRTTPGGRLQVRVLYTGYDAAGASAVGFAARYDPTGPLERQATPVYSVGAHERAPALFEWSGGSILYAEQDFGGGTGTPLQRAVAAAYAPADRALPPPAEAPDGP